ncbi:MAG: enoyl-CoA hydratase/isomerase family protein [Candidatus Acidiferrales bacterium]
MAGASQHPSQGSQSSGEPLVQEMRSGAVLTLRMNRPEKLNALNVELGRALVHALIRAAEDKEVRAVVLTGAGRGFCAGGDLALLRDVRQRKAPREMEGLLVAGKEICLAIATMTKPVIAAVNGPAAGGGMNLALACDLRIASDKAIFAESFANIGLYPDFGGTYFLPRIVGMALAAELFYTAETISAEDALRLGIVNRVVAADKFEQETKELAESLAAAPPLAIRDVKRTILADDRKALETKLDEEIRLQLHCFESEDCLEGLNAFSEKRKPQFRGH